MGVLIAVHSSTTSICRSDLVPDNTGAADILVVEVRLPQMHKMARLNIYNPPGTTTDTVAVSLRKTLTSIVNAGFNSIKLLGYFNLPNLDTESPRSHPLLSPVINMMRSFRTSISHTL